jgi:phenylalanyl-tRNA synthetase beta chain
VAVEATGVDPAAPSPWFMRRRLAAAGIRSISLAVDVTNYVMLETGPPLHAFDADKLDGGIVVRRAAAGEALQTLDEKDRTLDGDDVVVADQSRAQSQAGVMGGAASEISPATTNVVIEAANWDPSSISRTVRRHRLPSEAARRYERWVDPAISAVAAETAGALLVRYGGGALGGRTDAGAVPESKPIELPVGEAGRLAGRYYTLADMKLRLEQVGCRVEEQDADVLSVTPPTWRPDLTRPADLVEEIARLEGYGTIIPMLPIAPAGSGLTAEQRRRRRVADALAGAGLTQVLSFPFLGAGDLDALGVPVDDRRRRAVTVANPLDTERPLMATTLLPGLLSTALRNLSRGTKDLALYEVGQVVLPADDLPLPPALPVTRRPSEEEQRRLFAAVPAQPVHVAAVLTGQWERLGWWGPGRSAGVGDVFAVARHIGAVCGVTVALRPAEYAPWHPGRCAAIVAGGQDDAGNDAGGTVIGYAGELHPAVVERLGLPARTLAIEVDLSTVGAALPPVPPTVSPFPPVHLDVALTVDAVVDADSVMHALKAGGGDLLESTRLFDVYDGDQIADGKKSLAFSLVVRATDRTLTVAEATAVRDAAVASAAARTGAEIRA